MTDRVLKISFPLSNGIDVLIHILGGEPTSEQFAQIHAHLGLMDQSLNGSERLAPSQPVVIESTVTGNRPRHEATPPLHQIATVRNPKPPCELHPELGGPIARSLFTNRCPVCDGKRLEKARKERRYFAVSDQQRTFILASYPAKTQEQLSKETGVSINAVRTVLIDGGHTPTRRPGAVHARHMQNRMLRQA